MVKPFNGFMADDGTKFACEADAHRYEIQQQIATKFPGMKSAISTIMDNAEWFAVLLSPLAPKPENHPAHAARPPLAGTTLPASDKPKWDACQHNATKQTGNDKRCLTCNEKLPDPCPKGGDHDWVAQHNGLVDECTKCKEGRA